MTNYGNYGDSLLFTPFHSCFYPAGQDADYALYRGLIAAAARKAGAEVWSYCFMPNHVHLIVTPSTEDGLRATFAEAHRRYTGAINAPLDGPPVPGPLRGGGDG